MSGDDGLKVGTGVGFKKFKYIVSGSTAGVDGIFPSVFR